MRPDILTSEIRAELAKVMTGYRPWDQEVWLGEPPWMLEDPRLIAWEEAHGHDPRLKCYPEFGCLVEWKEYLFPHVRLACFILAEHYPDEDTDIHDAPLCHTCGFRAGWPCPVVRALAVAWEVEV